MSYPSSQGGDQATAFRSAEKKYQLHFDQVIKYSKGRARGTKLQVRATDLSDVVDLANPSQPPELGVRVTSHWSPVLGKGVFSFQAHPGLYVIPGALVPAQQCQLIADSLTSFPQGPNHTNFTKQHGVFPEGVTLWEAARQGLGLHRRPGPSSQHATPLHPMQKQLLQQGHVKEGPHPAASQAGSQTCTCPAATAAAAAAALEAVAALELASPNGAVPAEPGCQSTAGPAASGAGAGATTSSAAAVATCASVHHCPGGARALVAPTIDLEAPARGVWGPMASAAQAIPAAKLLRKLRWATLGPPFDWTQRVYRRDVQYAPLPQYLNQLGMQLAAAVERLESGNGSSSCEGAQPAAPCGRDALRGSRSRAAGLAGATPHSSSLNGEADARTAASGGGGGRGSSGAAAAEEWGGDCDWDSKHLAGGRIGGRKPFLPDVALVNYYHEGETLGGHMDDAELDLDQPIITLSLGCEAIFLMGGRTRDTRPLALLLRSGDAVVLAGEARRCFHGVPRIFTDRPLPPGLQCSSSAGEEGFAAFSEYMRSCRINISIRAVS